MTRADGTVPLQVKVEDATVASTLKTRPTPLRVPAWKALLRRLADRSALHDAGAQ
ncbi:hypothetical protein ACFYOV_28930 [Streptomyces sp. NPDC005931]|uniref:hypothetical protein n=1 Tax=Streptomyces sp. NPDC005931 TaxID=3364737 RepID=UPI0036BB49F2